MVKPITHTEKVTTTTTTTTYAFTQSEMEEFILQKLGHDRHDFTNVNFCWEVDYDNELNGMTLTLKKIENG